MRTRLSVISLFLASLWLIACGAPHAPLPPSLELARPVTDLSAVRKGNKVVLTWSAPTETTDGQNVRASRIGPAQICRGVAIPSRMTQCVQDVGRISPQQVPIVRAGDQAKRMSFTDTLPEQVEREHETQFATYGVQMLNWRGRSAGFSNEVRVPLAPVAAPPANVSANVAVDSVHLSFTCQAWVRNGSPLAHYYRVYRRAEGTQNAVPIQQFPADRSSGSSATTATFSSDCRPTDKIFEWEKTYYYHITPVTVVRANGKQMAEVEGDDSPEVKVYTHDVFPPAEPTGVQAVYSGPGQKPFMDVTWAPNTDPDLAGYNVYRHEEGQAPVKINSELVKTPSYRDQNVQPGRAYFYSVTAVDLRGNESAKSEEASERVP